MVLVAIQEDTILAQVNARTNSSTISSDTTSIEPQQDLIAENLVKINEQLSELKKEINEVRGQSYQRLIDQVNSSTASSNLVIQWSGFILTLFAVVVSIIGFLGFREYRSIRNRYKEAEHEVEKLKELFLEHVKSIEGLEKNFEEKLDRTLTKLESESQTFIEASYNFSVATAAYKEGDNEKAIEYFMRVLKLQPLNTRVLCRIGRAHTNLGDNSKAIEYFQKALSIEQNNAEAYRGLSTSLRYTDIDKAIENAKQAVQLDTQDFESYDYLGLLLRDNQQYQEAIEAHEQARQIQERPETDFFLSLLYAQQKDLDRAKLMIQSANIGLRENEVRDRIRPLWALLIRCAKHILEDNHKEAMSLAEEMHQYTSTERVTRAVLSHLKFLLEAVGNNQLVQEYTKVLKENGSPNLTNVQKRKNPDVKS